ncbi:MAG: ABC transporter substrate-binding protein [Desulfobacterales bacterium]|nr:ABC transporter substrate-binding protein [Desulfobacterales bacterium]
MNWKSYLIISLFVCSLFQPKAFGQYQAEVIHWWVSGGEAAALKVLVDEFESQGNTWLDTPVKDSYHAKTAALSRMFSGNPPTIVQWHVGVMIKDLYEEGLLGDVHEIARKHEWEKVLPEIIWDLINIDGKVVVVPTTLHGSNWLWASRRVLEACNVSMPDTWEDFKKTAAVIKEKGFIPLALGGQAWQETILFHNVVISVLGPKFYMDAFVKRDLNALGSPEMVRAFREFASLKPFVDEKSPGRNWAETTDLVIKGEAAFQIMGDWVKGEFLRAGMTAGEEIACRLCPGTEGTYWVGSDAFAMVALKDPKALKAQAILAEVAMDPEVQRRFNLKKGAVPPRTDVSLEGFDDCAKLGIKTIREGQVLPNLNMANPTVIASAILDVVHGFWNSETPDPENAAADLVAAVKEANF